MKQKYNALLSLFQNLCFLIWSKERLSPGAKHVIYLDCKDFRMQYYYFFVLFAYLEQGFFVRIKARPKLIAGFPVWVRDILKHPRVGIYFKEKRRDNGLYVTDIKDRKGINRRVFLTPAWFVSWSSGSEDIEYLPYQMHPDMYLKGNHKKAESLRKSKKQFAIFYSGNTSKDCYDSHEMFDKFGLQNRYYLIENLVRRLSENEILLLEGKGAMQELDGLGYINKLVMIKWGWTSVSSFNFEARVDPSEWLPTLAKAYFFLACPGIKIPYSHNAIEAMSVGAIPVLGYPSLFQPNLMDGVNCFVYKDVNDLISIIKKIQKMTMTDIEEMKRNVIDYYDKYLDNRNNINVINRALDNGKSITFFNETEY